MGFEIKGRLVAGVIDGLQAEKKNYVAARNQISG
jgi:hypothetical protein